LLERNGPHKFPDLLSKAPNTEDVEIKIALEDNSPKGHLAKEGYYLTCRYVLGDIDGTYTRGKENRGNVAWIWEIRFGWLDLEDFNLSNTPGDSGKTAVIKGAAHERLSLVYCDLDYFPYPKTSRARKYKDYYRLVHGTTPPSFDA